jgi:hypothetical protein
MRGLCPRAPGIYRFRARMAPHWGGVAAPVIPAAESALEFHPWRALSSAQVIAIITPGIWSIQGICAQALTTGLRTALYSHSDWYKIPVRPRNWLTSRMTRLWVLPSAIQRMPRRPGRIAGADPSQLRRNPSPSPVRVSVTD